MIGITVAHVGKESVSKDCTEKIMRKRKDGRKGDSSTLSQW